MVWLGVELLGEVDNRLPLESVVRAVEAGELGEMGVEDVEAMAPGRDAVVNDAGEEDLQRFKLTVGDVFGT